MTFQLSGAHSKTPPVHQTKRTDITELSRNQLAAWFEANSMRSFRADQVMRWIYNRRASSFDDMTNINKGVREQLTRHFTIRPLVMVEDRRAADGTRKLAFALEDDNRIETVLIGEKDHYTLCISTQAGCAMGCTFCMTAKGGLIRNLTPGEIIGQVMAAREMCPEDRPLTNIVLMGMGEPLANYENVMQALSVITDAENGLKFASRRITLSTAGIVPKIALMGKESKIRLAVSLNAPDDETRNMLMPVNRTYPIEMLLDACKAYARIHRDRITFEYILIKGINDSVGHAKQLAKLLAPIRGKVNLIPCNPHEGSPYSRPDASAIEAFHAALIEKHYTAMIRWSKGDDISAACGQLAARK
ncbi:MAG: 23S rRNA (adenine(2503)-C(2))-methyltransferase RlmN [Desulfosalsimonadaceae bacterium]